MTQEEIQQRMSEAPVLTSIDDSKDREAVEEVLAHKGFWLLYGLMLGTRQGQYAQLSYINMRTMAEVSQASVIQGKIQGLELFAQTVLEQGIPSSEPQKEQR